jgi:hypothetical protein
LGSFLKARNTPGKEEVMALELSDCGGSDGLLNPYFQIVDNKWLAITACIVMPPEEFVKSKMGVTSFIWRYSMGRFI